MERLVEGYSRHGFEVRHDSFVSSAFGLLELRELPFKTLDLPLPLFQPLLPFVLLISEGALHPSQLLSPLTQ